MPLSRARRVYLGEAKMPSAEIEEFARILVREVRDGAIRNCDRNLRPTATDAVAKRWRESAPTEGTSAAPRVVIPDCVDETIFYLLQAVDHGVLRLKFVSSTGKEIDLGKDGEGELSGWYMSTGGWRARFSGERFVDDFSSLGVP
jgi:hypothetical protein